jgi:hypothetical protein
LVLMETPEPRATVARLLRTSRSHAGLERALEGFPMERAGERVEGHPHSAWQQLEHMRISSEDLLRYCRDAEYRELGWPDAYWPESSAPPSAVAWEESANRLLEAVEAMARMVEDPEQDLYAPVPAAIKPDHHLLRAALILLDHQGYHVGQLVALRRALGAWPAKASGEP